MHRSSRLWEDNRIGEKNGWVVKGRGKEKKDLLLKRLIDW